MPGTDSNMKEVKYVCTTEGCKNEQVIRYWLDEQPLPFTCCVSCRAGFGKDPAQMAAYRIGMFPVATVAHS